MRGEPSPKISLLPCRMEPEVNELIMDSLNINYIDESEYPSTTDIQNRCCSRLRTDRVASRLARSHAMLTCRALTL